MKEQDFTRFTEYRLFYQLYKAKITSLETNSMLNKKGIVSSMGAQRTEGTCSIFLSMWIIIT